MGLFDLQLRTTGLEGPYPITAQRIIDVLSGSPSASGANVTAESAMRVSAVYACVHTIAETLGSLPLPVYQRNERGRVLSRNHYLWTLLHDQPNPWMTAMEFRETMTGHVVLRGNAFAEIVRDNLGRPVQLWPLRPDRMAVEISADKNLLYRYTQEDGAAVTLRQDQVLHIRGFSPDGVLGYSPIALHRETVGFTMSMLEYGNRFFGQGARPGGVLQAPTKLSKDAAQRMKESWESAHQGLGLSHRVAVLEEGVEWKDVGISQDDAQYLESRKFQVEDIARIFRMPLHKIGMLEHATFSNIEHQAIEFVTDTIRPWCVRWEQEIQRSLFGTRTNFYAEHEMEGLLRGDIKSRYEAYGIGRQWGFLSVNDIHANENMPQIPGGDTLYMPTNLAPVGPDGSLVLPEPPTPPEPATPPAPEETSS